MMKQINDCPQCLTYIRQKKSTVTALVPSLLLPLWCNDSPVPVM